MILILVVVAVLFIASLMYWYLHDSEGALVFTIIFGIATLVLVLLLPVKKENSEYQLSFSDRIAVIDGAKYLVREHSSNFELHKLTNDYKKIIRHDKNSIVGITVTSTFTSE